MFQKLVLMVILFINLWTVNIWKVTQSKNNSQLFIGKVQFRKNPKVHFRFFHTTISPPPSPLRSFFQIRITIFCGHILGLKRLLYHLRYFLTWKKFLRSSLFVSQKCMMFLTYTKNIRAILNKSWILQTTANTPARD